MWPSTSWSPPWVLNLFIRLYLWESRETHLGCNYLGSCYRSSFDRLESRLGSNIWWRSILLPLWWYSFLWGFRMMLCSRSSRKWWGHCWTHKILSAWLERQHFGLGSWRNLLGFTWLTLVRRMRFVGMMKIIPIYLINVLTQAVSEDIVIPIFWTLTSLCSESRGSGMSS